MTEVGSIYSAVYSGVPVFEMVVNGVAVMRRRTDSYMNATQILKVANIEKGKRTKILEKEVLIGDHEKVQGGYGKYQGTWIPFDKSRDLATRYNVIEQLAPLFNFELDNIAIQEGEDALLTKEQAMVARKKLAAENTAKQHQLQPRLDVTKEEPTRKKAKLLTTRAESSSKAANSSNDRNRSILMSIYLSDKPDQIPTLLRDAQGEQLNIDMVIDDQGNTALHWAVALARINTLELLVLKGANIACTNYAGETPLIKSVMVTNNFDNNCFPKVFDLLKDSITLVDHKKRTALHHAALTAGIQGRMNAAIYYMKVLVQYIQQQKSDELMSILDSQDALGDTALNIAARLDCQTIVDMLIDAGAQQNTQNNNGLQANDYQQTEDIQMEDLQSKRKFSNISSYSKKAYTPSQRGKEIIATVQKIVDALDEEYGVQLASKEQELQKVQDELDSVTRELEITRKGLEIRQAQSQKISEVQQKIRNIETTIQQGWEELKDKSTQSVDEITHMDENEDIDAGFHVPAPEIPSTATEEEKKSQLDSYVKQLQATIKAYTVNNLALEKEIKVLDEQYIEKEMQCKRLIAACCNLPIDKIDDLVEPLTLAIESDPPDLDLARVIGFMDKIRRQGAFAESSNMPHSPQPESSSSAAP